ncbi:hypothetical protein XENOCAPTIV_022197 [Xenoophorus captivus]|uniref:LRRCT domain-containing protein n=1 Tax=Xenoophorus captivus TaxID=1517983 RepID=A0ABV0QNS2_9TELE
MLTMERLLLCVMLAISMAVRAQICPKRCVCQILSPNLATLCAKKGLLFVPPNIDRHTVELRLADNFKMTSLHTLSLDHNMLDYIPEGTFSLLQKLNRLDVTSNKLQKLPPDPLFQRAQVLATSGEMTPSSFALSFGGNPLHCNCELLWLRRLKREDDLETCATPEHLSGRYFWSISEEEFLCEPPLITRFSHEMRVLEGQRVALRYELLSEIH